MPHQPRLLHHHLPAAHHHKIRNPANLKSRRKLLVAPPYPPSTPPPSPPCPPPSSPPPAPPSGTARTTPPKNPPAPAPSNSARCRQTSLHPPPAVPPPAADPLCRRHIFRCWLKTSTALDSSGRKRGIHEQRTSGLSSSLTLSDAEAPVHDAAANLSAKSAQRRVIRRKHPRRIVRVNPRMNQPLTLRDKMPALLAAFALAQRVRIIQPRQHANIVVLDASAPTLSETADSPAAHPALPARRTNS